MGQWVEKCRMEWKSAYKLLVSNVSQIVKIPTTTRNQTYGPCVGGKKLMGFE